jgi:hypothetical protein
MIYLKNKVKPMTERKSRSFWRNAFSKSNLEYIELLLKVAAFIIGAYWTYYIFKYQYVILPNTEPTSLMIKSSVTKISSDDSLDLYQLEITLQNKSKLRVQLPSSYYNIVASKIRKQVLSINRYKPGALPKDSVYLNNFFTSDTSQMIIVQTDRILNDNSFINPESEFNIQRAFALTKNEFDLLTVDISTISSKVNSNNFVTWSYDNVGRLTANLFIVEDHLFRKADTLEYNYEKQKPYSQKHDLYFTTLGNNYLIRNIGVKAQN